MRRLTAPTEKRLATRVIRTARGGRSGRHQAEFEPSREVVDLTVDSGGDGLARLDVPVESVDTKHAAIAVRSSVKLSYQPVAVQNGQSEVSPATTCSRFVHLERVVELEQVGHALAIMEHPVKGRQ